MKLALDLPTDVSLALRRLAKDLGVDPEQAAIHALRDALIASGYLEAEYEIDEDTETEGNA